MTWAFLIDSVPFTKDVIEGKTSLGGSESATIGVARALSQRGETVHLFVGRLDPALASYVDSSRVAWHPLEAFRPMNRFVEWDVMISSRQVTPFLTGPVHARLRLLWAQDLLVPGQMAQATMAAAFALDQIVYVSPYHQAQWEQLEPNLKRPGFGWVSRNGYDPANLPPRMPKKAPGRVIFVSRPERGLDHLLAMWPLLRKTHPTATLALCRYSSMYDQGPGSWSDVCANYDRMAEAVNNETGGIVHLGELDKPTLFRELARSVVMWYPGPRTFAETGCIAAVEAQACGTPVVGSYRGVLPDLVTFGELIAGDPKTDAYQSASLAAVATYLDTVDSQAYREGQESGRDQVQSLTYSVLAQEWQQHIEGMFRRRFEDHPIEVMRQLLYEDDHVGARQLIADYGPVLDSDMQDAKALCQHVIDGKDHTAEEYGARALPDPVWEADHATRFKVAVEAYAGRHHVLDVACGNGSFAIACCRAHPNIRVTGLDYSAQNIEVAKQGAERAGVADRCDFQQATVYDFAAHTMHADWHQFVRDMADVLESPTPFDGLFVGEFIEHLASTAHVIDALEAPLQPGSPAVYTCPHGACVDLLPPKTPHHKGHVHRFHHDDIRHVWGQKTNLSVEYLESGTPPRGYPFGNWIIRYETGGGPARDRPLAQRIQRTRPMVRLSVGILAKDAESDIKRVLDSVYGVADEILVGDTGSTDGTVGVVETYGHRVRLVRLDPVEAYREGFAGARNALMRQATGDWFLWIDTDEQLMNPAGLRKYLDGNQMFTGFVLRQKHVYLDGPPTYDIPVRLFKLRDRVQFYGCIHEQPQDGDANTQLHPTLELNDVEIAHFGYLTNQIRETKRVTRNLPLLKRDQEVFPDRVLGKVLVCREAVIEGDRMRAQAGGMTPPAQQAYAYAVKTFIDYFDDPAHRFHHLARPWYEAALQHLGLGWHHEIALAGIQGDLEGRRAKPERVRVRDGEELRRLMAYKVSELADKMAPPTFITDPDELMGPAAHPTLGVTEDEAETHVVAS